MEEGPQSGPRRPAAAGKGERLKQVVVERIRSGAYPVGARLPGVRAAAEEFGVHANTVSRVYGELAEDGILRTAHGSGTYVVSVPGDTFGDRALSTLTAALADLAEQARHLGLTRESWEQLVARSAETAFKGDAPAIWMVECSRKDVQELSQSLTRLLDREVGPLLVEEVPAALDASNGDDVFLTTPFHYDEVAAVLGDRRMLLSVNVVPTPETLVSFAGLKPGAEVSVIASNQPTLDRMVRMVRTFARVTPVAAVLVDDEGAERTVRDASVLVDSQSIHDRVMAWGPPGQTITVRYQIEPTSIAYVGAVLRLRDAENEPASISGAAG